MENKAEDALKEKIAEALKAVLNPGTNMNIVDMGLLKELKVNANKQVDLCFKPASTICPMAFKLGNDIQQAVQKVPGVGQVNIRVQDYVHAEELERILNAP